MSHRRQGNSPPPIPPPERRVSRTARKQRQLKIFLVSLVAVVVLAIGGVFLYQTYVAPYQRTVLKVGNLSVKMGYFLKRAKLAGDDPTTMLQQLTDELIVETEAPKYGISISNTQIDQALQTIAANSSTNVTDNATQSAPPLSQAAYKKWYSNTLKTSGLSDAEYRDMIRTRLMASQLQVLLVNSLPAKTQQVHLYVIAVNSQADAAKAESLISSGEPFQDVARAMSVDQSGAQGGDVGWIPPGVLAQGAYDSVIFQLNAGQVSQPIASNQSNPSAGQYVIFMVSEKDASREVSAANMQTLQSNVFYEWLNQETQSYIQNNQIQSNIDSKTMAWIEWQLQK